MTDKEFAKRLRYYAKWIEEAYGDLPTDRPPGPPRSLLEKMRLEAEALEQKES